MANPKIRAKRSSVEGKVPSTTQLERGEFAVNTYDGKVYVLKDQYSVGIATTTVNVNPWSEPNGIGAGVSYSGSVTATSFAGDGSALTNLNVAGVSTFSGNYNHLFNSPTIPTNNNQLTNGAGYITNDVSGNLNLGDSDRLRLGDAPDFEIYHDGSNSYINNYTGRLRIQTPGSFGVDFRKNVSELIAQFQPDGAVSLYYDAVKKFETSSTGVDVTGNITVSGTVDGVDVAALSSTVAGIDTSGFPSGTIPTNNNQLTNGAGYITASSVPTNNNQLTNGAGYITVSSVPTNNNQLTNGQGFITGYTVTSSDVTQHEGDITITESQISDLGTYLTSSDLSSYATQSYVNTQVSNLVDSAPSTLDTLNELAAALGDDANFSTTVTDSIATKMPLAGGTFTGAVTFASGQTFDYNNLTNTPTIPSNNNQLTNGAGFITNSVSGDLTLTDTATDNSAGPEFVLYRNSSSPASADYLGQIKFQGESTSGATRLYAKITGKIGDPTNGSEDGIIEIAHRKNGSNNISGRWNQDELQLLNGTELSLGDSQKIKVGAGDDLQIYHDGSHSYILDNGTGDLRLASNNITRITKGDSETCAAFNVDGSSELYYDNSLKLSTASGGVNIAGNLNLNSADSYEVRLGADNDLKIYHDGSNSRIKNTTGSLWLQSDTGIRFTDADVNESMAAFYDNGAVELYYDGSKKFETKSDGIDVTGEVQCDSLDVDGNADISGNATVHGQFYVGGEMGIMGTSDGDKYLDCRLGSSSFYIRGTSGGDANHETLAQFTRNGAVSLYHNNSKKFETSSSGVTVTGTVSATAFSGDGSSLTGISASNADTVDSLHASSFLRSDADSTTTGSIDINNINEALRVGDITGDDYLQLLQVNGTSIRNFSIQHSNASVLENLQGTTNQYLVLGDVDPTNSNTLFGISLSQSGTYYNRLTLSGTGNLTISGDITSQSDISLKDNVVTYENALDKVLAMRGVEYDRNDMEGKHEVGLIAQEVEEIIPEVVGEEGGIKNIAYGKLTAVLIEAIKEQQQQINDLRQQLNKGK